MHIRDYIEELKSKPEHIRRRVALGVSTGITGLVAIGWLVALGSSGTLALSTPADEAGTQGIAAAAQQTQTGFADLLGAASAFQAATDGHAPLTIVGTRASSTLDQPSAEDTRTVIPF
jgi:hypothetical protein